MRYFKEVLADIAKLPAAIEAKLPAAAPKLSKFMTDTASRFPTGPGSPVEIPELPVPQLPDLPAFPGGAGALGGLAPRPTGARGKINGNERAPMTVVGSRGKL